MKKTIAQQGSEYFKDKKVLVRVDFNVPQEADGSIADDSRIVAALPTINYLTDAKAKVILVSHLGRPKGRSEKLSLRPVAVQLSQLLNDKAVRVTFAEDCIGSMAKNAVDSLKSGDVCVLENLRFYAQEEQNDNEFAKKLADLADVYVNDAFGTAHRAHASTEGVTHFLRPALAGLLMDQEVRMLSQVVDHPARPFATVIGGAKVSSKLGILENLLTKVDLLVIGGAMAFTFLKARGVAVGKSLVEDDRLDYCRQLEKEARESNVQIILPVDVVCAQEIVANTARVVTGIDSIAPQQMGLDIGPKTKDLINDALAKCKTILWNGPMGVFETRGFEQGTYAVIDKLVELTRTGVKTIVGGGDSVAALAARGVPNDALTHVSTGGGAALEFIEGIALPGIACLDEADAVAATIAP